MNRFRREKIAVTMLLALAMLLRAGVLWSQSGNLSSDRDAYLRIAQNLADGHGYASGQSAPATAYRPPFYPFFLAVVLKCGGRSAAIGILHLLLGTATVLLTYSMGRQLGLGRAAVIAAGLVAVDPLMLQYTTFPMTETLFTFLVTLLLAVVAGASPCPGSENHAVKLRAVGESKTELKPSGLYLRQALLGVLFGLCALSRPTIWIFGLLGCIWWVCSLAWHRSCSITTFVGLQVGDAPPLTPPLQRGGNKVIPSQGDEAGSRALCFLVPGVALLAVALTVSPWLVRNLVVFGRPILTTTHGGYTLLLGNNPVFYHEVVEQPWGTVWDDAPREQTQEVWYDTVQAEMFEEIGADAGEPDRDRWMFRRALRNIGAQPVLFLRACWLRFLRFWNIVPLGTAADSISQPVIWGIGLFYGILTAGVLLGLARLRRADWTRWMPIVLLLVAFSLVHLFFWSNARMRAPLVPSICLLAAHGYSSLVRWYFVAQRGLMPQ